MRNGRRFACFSRRVDFAVDSLGDGAALPSCARGGADGAAPAQADARPMQSTARVRLARLCCAIHRIGLQYGTAGRFVLHTWRSVGLTPSATIKSERTSVWLDHSAPVAE